MSQQKKDEKQKENATKALFYSWSVFCIFIIIEAVMMISENAKAVLQFSGFLLFCLVAVIVATAWFLYEYILKDN